MPTRVHSARQRCQGGERECPCTRHRTRCGTATATSRCSGRSRCAQRTTPRRRCTPTSAPSARNLWRDGRRSRPPATTCFANNVGASGRMSSLVASSHAPSVAPISLRECKTKTPLPPRDFSSFFSATVVRKGGDKKCGTEDPPPSGRCEKARKLHTLFFSHTIVKGRKRGMVSASTLKTACATCAADANCPPKVHACCECLRTCLSKGTECHAMVHACRDIASRCACGACISKERGWQACCRCCFALCDACDSYCHQRCSLPEMMRKCNSGTWEMRCAFQQGPTIPGTVDYKAPRTVDRNCCVYCANSACGAERAYCDKLKRSVQHLTYPGGLLEYYCRSTIDKSLPRLTEFEPGQHLHRGCMEECVP